MNKVVARPDLQLSVDRHLGVNIVSVKFSSHVPHKVPVLPMSQETIPSHVSFPWQQYPSGHLIIETDDFDVTKPQ